MSRLTPYVERFFSTGTLLSAGAVFWRVQCRHMRATTSLTAALLLSASLSACSAADDGPTILAPASPAPVGTSAEPSASSDIDVPVLPPEAEVQTAAGAMAFVRHYFAVVDYAYAAVDTAPLAAVSDPACRPCAGVKDMIDTAIVVGDSFMGSPTIISDISVPEPEPAEAVNVLLACSSAPLSKISRQGSEEPVFEAYSGMQLSMLLVFSGQKWQVRNYGEKA
jgi:hypothetical protein